MPRRSILKAERNRRSNRTAKSDKRCWAGAEHDHGTHRNTSPPYLQLGGASYDGMTNMEIRRKVVYRPRSHRAPKKATSHSARRPRCRRSSRSARNACTAAREMDTVEGARGDSARLPTLLHRPSRFLDWLH